MVSEWMENGNIDAFVQRNPNANRTELVRTLLDPHVPSTNIVQLIDVAKGLAYMHGLHLVHGDLKGVRSDHELYIAYF